VRASFFSAILLLIASALTLLVPSLPAQAPPQEQPPAPPAAGVAPPKATAPTPQTPAPATPQPPATPPKPTLSVVVLDPAHGGADAGARGPSGVLESEVVLSFARALRAQLEAQGLRVVQTRQVNENPSFDDRSTVANGQRNAVFISLHISSTGPVGTARAYSVAAAGTGMPRAGPIPWDRAQEPYADLSRHLAELVQVQLAQKFRGSPEVPALAAVRQLRTVAAPAIAIEISSVSVAERAQLEQIAPGLASAVGRALEAFRPLYEAGAK
jgi:N-acetylmuramoyl-L-alanine amidase